MSTMVDMAQSTDSDPRAVSVSILKGGVGKSTIATNVADRLAARDSRVLFIDLDPNGHATAGLGFSDVYHDDALNLGDVVTDEGDHEPNEIIHQTGFGFDIIPSTENLESVEGDIRDASFPSQCLKNRLVDPLLGDVYDYIVTDSPAYRGKLADNALVATTNMLIPVKPGGEAIAGFERTMERQITPLRELIDLDILAVVPNDLQQRIDQNTKDRQLIEQLNDPDGGVPKLVPDFARVTPAEFEEIDNGTWEGSLPKPGLRHADAFTQAFEEREPLAHYAPDHSQVLCLDALAGIVERGGIQR